MRARWVIGLWCCGLAQGAQAASTPETAEPPNDSMQLKFSPLMIPSTEWPALPPGTRLPGFAEADELSGQTDVWMQLDGHAQFRQANTVLHADRIHQEVARDELDAEGAVRLFQNGDLITGPKLKLNLNDQTGYFDTPNFSFAQNNARGDARQLRFLGKKRLRLEEATYSSCAPGNDDWFVKARSLDLDYVRGEGLGRNAVIYFKGVPILGSPLLSFPLGDERKSGFLPPTFGMSSKGGPEFMVPYYWNIAPDKDATFYPRVITRRGAQLGAQYRYLAPSYQGETRVEVLPDDRLTQTDRYSLASTHSQSLGAGFGLSWNLNHVSDDDYLRDFARDPAGVVSPNLLERSMALSFSRNYLTTTLRATRYQTLQDPLAPIVPPYDKLPQLSAAFVVPDYHGMTVDVQGDMTQFSQTSLVSGRRTYVYPTLSYAIENAGVYLRPKIGVHATRYALDEPTPGLDRNAHRTVPIASVDSGMVFERDASWFGAPVRQTLEPRAFYLRVPYRNQDRLPVFDTATADFNLAQIFSENLFSGWDRIADANQLTAALTTRWIDQESGVEQARLTAAQRTYFNDQQVTLPGLPARGKGTSDWLLTVAAAVSTRLSTEASLQYNPDIDRVVRANYGVRWQPAPRRTLAVSYRSLRGSLEQIETAAQWPLSSRWYGVGRINYSLRDGRPVDVLGGLEYDGGCWALRLVGQRVSVATQNTASSLYLQLELNGFARLGSNPLETLRRTIPGYEPINPPPPRASVFERYE